MIVRLNRGWTVNADASLNMKSKDHKKGKKYNKTVNNDWSRNLVFNNLKKRCGFIGVTYQEVFAAYSSFVGNVLYGKKYGDAIGASIELNRRGKANSRVEEHAEFPVVTSSDQWKDLTKVRGWMDFYRYCKSRKINVRVALKDASTVFRWHKFISRRNLIAKGELIA